MKIKDLSFCVEVTEKDTNNVDGGYIRDISSGIFDIIPGVIPSFIPVVDDSDFIGFERIRPTPIILTDLGGI
jgi:hypothetical protein